MKRLYGCKDVLFSVTCNFYSDKIISPQARICWTSDTVPLIIIKLFSVTAHVGSVAKTLQRGAEEIIETFFVDNSRIKDGVSFKGYAAKLSDK